MSIKSTKSSKTISPVLAEELERSGLEFYSHRNLKDYSWNGIGGVAEYVVIAKSITELVAAAKLALRCRTNYVVVGAISGTLVSSSGIPGMVIINRACGISYLGPGNQVLVESGVTLSQLVSQTASRGLGGVEYLTVIPGTLGGAIASAAYFQTHHIAQVVKEVIVFMPKVELQDKGEIVTVPAGQLWRGSAVPIFESPVNSPIILNAKLQLAGLPTAVILGRVHGFRALRKVEELSHTLGGVFTEPVTRAGLLDPAWGVVDFANKLRADKKDPDIWHLGRDVLSNDIRGLLERIPLRQRLTYLGYYSPMNDKEGDEYS